MVALAELDLEVGMRLGDPDFINSKIRRSKLHSSESSAHCFR